MTIPRCAVSGLVFPGMRALLLTISLIAALSVAFELPTRAPSNFALAVRGQLLQDSAAAAAAAEPTSMPLDGAECTVTEHQVSFSHPLFWVYVVTCMCCVCFGGLMSGLTVGFMSIDRMKLSVLREAGSDEEKDMAELVAPILENHHLLLVTLLFCNAMAMEALPIFLDRLVPSVAAVILSVTFVLIFGEVVPQAYCTSNPLKICAKTAWVVKLLQVCTYPVSFPVAKVLDRVLGTDHSAHVLFKRHELTALIDLHSAEEAQGTKAGGAHGIKAVLKTDEASVIRGALEFGNRKAKDVMTSMEHVCMLELDRRLNMDTLAEILGMGHSRIPVFHKSRHNIKGLLLVKRLIVCNPDNNRPVYHFVHRKPIVVTPNIGLYELLNVFQTGRSHMAIVTDHTREYHWAMSTGEDVPGYCRIQGVVTLEDVIEQLIQEEISDEVDNTTSASLRPWEKEEDREDYRTAGVQRALTAFRAILAKIRLRKRAVRAFLDSSSHKHAAGPIDISTLHMSATGDIEFDTDVVVPSARSSASSSLSSGNARQVSFNLDFPDPDGMSRPRDEPLVGGGSLSSPPPVRAPLQSQFGSFRRPRGAPALGDKGVELDRSAALAAQLETLMAEEDSGKKLRAMAAAKGKLPVPFSASPHSLAGNHVRRVYLQDNQHSIASPSSLSKVASATARASSLSEGVGAIDAALQQPVPPSALAPVLGHRQSAHEVYGDQVPHVMVEIPSESDHALGNTLDVNELPRIAALAKQIMAHHGGGGGSPPSASSPRNSPLRAPLQRGSGSVPQSPALRALASDGPEAEHEDEDDDDVDIEEMMSTGDHSGPFLSASAFEHIAKSSQERGLQRQIKQQQKQLKRAQQQKQTQRREE